MSLHVVIISLLWLTSSHCSAYYSVYHSSDSSSNCVIKSYGITDSDQLREAINSAKSGDTIQLDPIEYVGDFDLHTIHNKFVTIDGDNQCNKNTRIKGKVSIGSNNWIIRDIVFEHTATALEIKNVENIKLVNLVIENIGADAVIIQNSQDILLSNFVMDNINENAIELTSVKNVMISNLVVSDVDENAIVVDGSSSQISIINTVARDVDEEVIEIGNDVKDGTIRGTVITGSSPKGKSWVRIDGNNFKVSGTVGTGSPKNGFVVNGCGNSFESNICTMGSRGYCLSLNKRCTNGVKWGNLNTGGRGLYNYF